MHTLLSYNMNIIIQLQNVLVQMCLISKSGFKVQADLRNKWDFAHDSCAWTCPWNGEIDAHMLASTSTHAEDKSVLLHPTLPPLEFVRLFVMDTARDCLDRVLVTFSVKQWTAYPGNNCFRFACLAAIEYHAIRGSREPEKCIL